MIGFDRNELLEYTFPEPFWPSPFFSKSINDIDTYMQMGFLKIETFFQKKNNTFFPVFLTGSAIPEKEKSDAEYIILIEDISEKKKKEREFKLSQDMLISLNNKLENLVKKRTQQLQQVMKQKNEFINQLGHDLKNPLTPMMTFLPILYDKVSDEKCKEIISTLDKNVRFMKDLIVDTVELAKLDSVNIPLSFENINLRKEIDDILQSKFTFLNKKNIEIENNVNADLFIDVDKLRINELIINLISNSLKYGKENGSVTIVGDKLDDRNIELKIVDDGIGMSTDQVESVFKEFYRVNQKNSTFKSSGLGMTICKKIVEKHGGSIYCHSEGVGKGTTVGCILPIKNSMIEEENNTQIESSISSEMERKSNSEVVV